MSIIQIIEEHKTVIAGLIENCLEDIKALSDLCVKTLLNGQTIFFCGNGGSAADSQHLAAEIVGRFETERRPLKAIAFTVDTSILTAVSNDYGYDQIFARQAEALIRPQDLLIGLSTSGNSRNIILAMEKAKSQGAYTAALTGLDGGALAKLNLCDICVKVPSQVTARIQEAHILIGHALCAEIDNAEATSRG